MQRKLSGLKLVAVMIAGGRFAEHVVHRVKYFCRRVASTKNVTLR